jgi:TolB-like protein
MIGGVEVKKVKDLVIVALLVAFVHLLVTGDGTAAVSETSGSSTTSIAVLPYFSVNGDVEYPGFTDSLWGKTISSLEKDPTLRVASRASSSQYRDPDDDIRIIAETLGVSYVVEGSVMRFDNHVRIMAKLIRIDDGTNVLTISFDRNVASVESIESIPLAIATMVARAIERDSE